MSYARADRTRKQRRRRDRRINGKLHDNAPTKEKFTSRRQNPELARPKSRHARQLSQRSQLQIAKDRLIAVMRHGRFRHGIWAEEPKEAVANLKPEVHNHDRKLGRGKEFYKLLLNAFLSLLGDRTVTQTRTHDGYSKFVLAEAHA